jgi:phosphate transport system permease protein
MATRFQRAKRIDRLATVVISVGGVAVIFCVIAILVLIAREALPLFAASAVEPATSVSAGGDGAPAPVGFGLGDRMENGFVLRRDGAVEVFGIPAAAEDRRAAALEPPAPGAFIAAVAGSGDGQFTIRWSTGQVTLDSVRFEARFNDAGDRTLAVEVERLMTADVPPGAAVRDALARVADDGRETLVLLGESGGFSIRQRTRAEDFLGNVATEDFETVVPPRPGDPIETFDVDLEGRRLFAGTGRGRLLGWDLRTAGAAESIADLAAAPPDVAIRAVAFVFGGQSVAAADAAGGYGVWSMVPIVQGQAGRELVRIHDLAPPPEPIRRIYPSRRDKSMLAVTDAGAVLLDHTTSEGRLLQLPAEPTRAREAVLSRRGNGFAVLDDAGVVSVWRLDNPHPETNARVLFGKVWYEGYREPAYVWQSSAATDDFEPKLSLVPLIFGSIKGTLYAMLLAVPLALFGALYTSQLTRPEIRDVVKPVVEIMAAIPSVILGFLAALWLAPLFERNLGSVFLSVVLIPACVILAIAAWGALRRYKPLQPLETGFEFVVLVPVLIAGVLLAVGLGPVMERLLFDGDIKAWLYQEAGVRYDPRNCIVIAFALGFAVIPIIFTIAEDAFSNVPRSLTAGSLALGASRWQTVWRVVLPSASPGIFAGIVIGLGRAVGETMIVLMATGNTPIIDWSIFNGMRTLSANIAVEVPEAPHGGTLYRVLFLSAMVLFIMTFTLNTLAEVVRHRLRKKYAQFQ